ncbi:MAG: chloride channel protein, partial [Paludibacteraceae bacterium]|nr:chloride channel protein [Paludibacteraceae bacterium]
MLEEYFIKILRWREKNVSERHFIIFLSLLTGFFCAIAAHLLKSIVDLLHELVKSYFTDGSLNYLYL